jgi:putative AlgH/UPF0301 family transcriptional regulator
VQIRAGSLLIAHPAYADKSIDKHVVLVTESTNRSTMGLTLNVPNPNNLIDIMQDQGVNWPLDDPLFTGGFYNTRSMIMLHSSEWISTSTMQVSDDWAISSDTLMIEKLGQYDIPRDYKMFIGCTGWRPRELVTDLDDFRPKWLVMDNPSKSIVMADPEDMWTLAIMECSQNSVDAWI